MAGNPFRRSGAIPAAVAGREAAAEPSPLHVDTLDTTVKPKKVPKRVRIQSPVVSPDEPSTLGDPFDARLNDMGHPGSPPPPDHDPDIATEMRTSFIDSVAKGASNLNLAAIGDERLEPQRTGLRTETTPTRAAQQPPHNPFAKTLATIEGGYGLVPTTTNGLPTDAPAQRPNGLIGQEDARGTGKAAMDVDAFTAMLLNGTSGPSPVPRSVEGGSSDTLPAARHSTFDPVHHIHPESPRSSFDGPGSGPDDDADADDDDDDNGEQNEHASLVADPLPRRPKPPPPSNRRGKMLPKKGPQIVSFAEFDSAPQTLDQGLSSAAASRPTLNRSASDLNKPLPPPPPPDPLQHDNPPIPEEEAILPNTGPSPDVAADSYPKRSRPTPPVSRRASQTRIDTSTGRIRSSSTLSKSSIPEDSTPVSSTPQPELPQHTKPPPPPSRRPANAISSAERRESSVSQSLQGIPPQPSANKAPPPPPPSRQALRGAPPLTRSPSSQSTVSLGHRRASPSLGQVPPPPPPRRADKRSSFDGFRLGSGSRRPSDVSQRSSAELRRSSGASYDPSTPSLQHVPEGDGNENAKIRTRSGDMGGSESQNRQPNAGFDILADMSAFQAEIDALRAQIGK